MKFALVHTYSNTGVHLVSTNKSTQMISEQNAVD